ncbi:hypothetical protein G9A89_002562 [Geosiphon pyriformis]|nr:hypothetical protein G9A89_002562 [Geosiphon pyriformis]
MAMTKAKSKKAVLDIFPEISNKISTKEAFFVVKAIRQNILEAFSLSSNCKKLSLIATEATSLSLAGFSLVKVLLKRHTWVSSSVVFTLTKSPKVFNNKLVNKLIFLSIASIFGAFSTSSKKIVKKTKSSEKWRQLLASAIVTPNSFVVPNEISNKISVVSSGILFKIGQNQLLAVLPNVSVHGFLDAKSVSKDNVKLFCMKFAFQNFLDAVFLVELTSSVHFATLKIAKFLIVSESGSPSAAIALHNVPLGVSAANIKMALGVFGEIFCIQLRSAGIWQYVVVYFKNLDAATSALNHWSVLVGKDTSASLVAVVDFLVSSWLASLKSDLAKLFVLVESIIKSVGSMVKVFEQFVNSNLVSSSALGLKVNKVLVHISIFSRTIGKLKQEVVALKAECGFENINMSGPYKNTLGNCKDSLKEDPKQQVDFSSAFEKEYINTYNNQELRNNLHHDIKEKAFSITEKTKVATKTPNLTVLEFCHAIYTQNQSNLGLPEGCCPAESALIYYINARINYHIRKKEELHNAKLGLYRELSQYITKEVAVIAATIVKIYREIEQYANKNFLIFTGNTRECANKTKKKLETNQESNQQKLGTLAQTPKNTPKFGTEFENHEEESELESKKKTSKKTITRLVTGTSSQSRNQKTYDQEKKLNIKEATFRNAQGNIIPLFLRPISPPAENGNKMAISYITRLTDFSEEEKKMDIYTWLREVQKAIQANNWSDQRAIQTLLFFLKGTANLWYQSLETKPISFAKFKNALLEYFSDPNTIIQLQNKFNTIKQDTDAARKSATVKIIAHHTRNSEQKYVPAIFANA